MYEKQCLSSAVSERSNADRKDEQVMRLEAAVEAEPELRSIMKNSK